MCEVLVLPGGGTAIICGVRGRHHRAAPCVHCRRPSEVLCDHRNGSTTRRRTRRHRCCLSEEGNDAQRRAAIGMAGVQPAAPRKGQGRRNVHDVSVAAGAPREGLVWRLRGQAAPWLSERETRRRAWRSTTWSTRSGATSRRSGGARSSSARRAFSCGAASRARAGAGRAREVRVRRRFHWRQEAAGGQRWRNRTRL